MAFLCSYSKYAVLYVKTVGYKLFKYLDTLYEFVEGYNMARTYDHMAVHILI